MNSKTCSSIIIVLSNRMTTKFEHIETLKTLNTLNYGKFVSIVSEQLPMNVNTIDQMDMFYAKLTTKCRHCGCPYEITYHSTIHDKEALYRCNNCCLEWRFPVNCLLPKNIKRDFCKLFGQNKRQNY